MQLANKCAVVMRSCVLNLSTLDLPLQPLQTTPMLSPKHKTLVPCKAVSRLTCRATHVRAAHSRSACDANRRHFPAKAVRQGCAATVLAPTS
eukprot:11700510-Alexandrium_andersonii.AAC.1